MHVYRTSEVPGRHSEAMRLLIEERDAIATELALMVRGRLEGNRREGRRSRRLAIVRPRLASLDHSGLVVRFPDCVGDFYPAAFPSSTKGGVD